MNYIKVTLAVAALFTAFHFSAHATEPSMNQTQKMMFGKPHYVLVMSENDSICKPILEEYNRNIHLDYWDKPKPTPYPWPAPDALAVKWLQMKWDEPKDRQGWQGNQFTVIEADLNNDGKKEKIVRYADWLRSDYRSTTISIFKIETNLPIQVDEYEKIDSSKSISKIIKGVYTFPKMKDNIKKTSLNDFDVIQIKGKFFVTGKTVIMDGIDEEHDVEKWRVVSRIRLEVKDRVNLNRVLNSVCYFRFETK